MTDFDDFYYKNMTTSLEERASLDEIQMSRKQRYYQRLNRPKPPPEEIITKKRKKLWVKDDSDDEMPTPAPKPKRQRKKAAPKEKVVEVIVLDDDTEINTPSSTTPPSSKPKPSSSKPSEKPSSSKEASAKEKEVENKDPTSAEDKEKTPEEEEMSKEEDMPEMTPHEYRLRGRLPTWYHERQAQRLALQQKNSERKELRLKMEKEEAEKQAVEDKKEERRKRDRERKRQITILKRLEGKDSGDLEAIVRENNENLDEKMKKQKKKAEKQNKITDPSLDPSIISLGAPEIVPWATKQKAPPRKKSPSPSLPSTSSSESSEEAEPIEEPSELLELIQEQTELGAQNPEDFDDPTSLANLMETVDFSDLVLTSPTSSLPTLDGGDQDPSIAQNLFSIDNLIEHPDAIMLDAQSPFYFNIGDEILDVTENDIELVELDDNFLTLMNDDTILLDPVHAFNSLS